MTASFHTFEWVVLHKHVDHCASPRYDVVTSHVWMAACHTFDSRYITHMNAACHTFEWVMSRTFERIMSQAHADDRVNQRHWIVTSHLWMSHVAVPNESCHTFQRTSNVDEGVEPWHKIEMHTCRWVVWHRWMGHDIDDIESINLPDPMNHVKIVKGQPHRFALWELVPKWYK